MENSISAAEANRHFSHLLREVREGRSFIVTAHGKPVAKIIPFDDDDEVRGKAKAALLARLKATPAIDVGPWKRDELYDEAP